MNLAEFAQCQRMMRARRMFGPVTPEILQEARLCRAALGRAPADPSWKPRYRVRAYSQVRPQSSSGALRE